MKYDNFWLISLDAEGRARTCGYWYLVQTYGGTSHTAFRSKAALLRWLGEMNLNPTAYIPDEGIHSCQRMHGSYSVIYANRDTFEAAVGIPTRTLNNGRYVDGRLVRDEAGHTTLYVAHYNGAREYDHRANDDFYHGPWKTPGRVETAAS